MIERDDYEELTFNATEPFGKWLKQRRKELGLTQEQLAQAANCAAITVRKLEAGSRKPTRQILESLLKPLEIPKTAKTAFIQYALKQIKVVQEDLSFSAINTLPIPLTSLLGREAEIAAICNLLERQEVRLLTLIGPAGTGKTRLALHLAQQLLPKFDNNVLFVPLAAVREKSAVVGTIAKALNLSETGRQSLLADLKLFLSSKNALLVLDNFEQVVSAAPILLDILQSCPNLKILVTSRTALRVRGEYEFAVPTLELPNIEANLENLAENPAVKLFIERIQAIKPDFYPILPDLVTIALICKDLDALPLALELAASHIKYLTLDQLKMQLTNRLNWLNRGAQDLPTRHRTLRNALDWDYDLLKKPDKMLFRRLGVFTGSFNLTAVQQICLPETNNLENTLSQLEALVDCSLLRQLDSDDDEPRFTMLAVIREYAAELLSKNGLPQTNQHYITYYLSFVETAAQKLKGPEQIKWLNKLEQESANFWVVFNLLLEQGQIETALHFSAQLRQYWFIRGYLSEGRDWLQLVLSYADSSRPTSALAEALDAAGFLAWAASDYVVARSYGDKSVSLWSKLENQQGVAQALLTFGLALAGIRWMLHACGCLEESLTILNNLDDTWATARTLNYLGYLKGECRDYTTAKAHLEYSLALFETTGDSHAIAGTLNNLGCVLLELGYVAEAGPILERSLALFSAVGDRRQRAWTLNSLGELNRYLGNYAQAEIFYRESLGVFRQMDQKSRIAQVLHNLGHTLLNLNNYDEATKFFVESLALRRSFVSSNTVTLGILECIAGLAAVISYIKQPELSVQLLSVVSVLLEHYNLRFERADCTEFDRNLAFTRTQLDESAWLKMWQQGQSLSLDKVFDLVIS